MENIITLELLKSTGITVPEEQLSPLLDYMNGVLEDRIGEAVVENLNDDELEELVALQESGDDEQVQIWLDANIPDLAEIIEDEVTILLGEAAQHHTDFSAQ